MTQVEPRTNEDRAVWLAFALLSWVARCIVLYPVFSKASWIVVLTLYVVTTLQSGLVWPRRRLKPLSADLGFFAGGHTSLKLRCLLAF